MWIKYNDSTKLYQWSTDQGVNWFNLSIDAAQIGQGTLGIDRIPSIPYAKLSLSDGDIPWAKVTKSGAVPGDVGAAPAANGVTNGDSHDHNGGDGGTISYTNLSNKPTIPSLLDAFPVDSIFINVSGTNPQTFLGGTWVAFGAGKVLVGLDSGDTAFDTVLETGGEKTHQLTTGEMPSHNHGGAHTVNITDPTHRHDITYTTQGGKNAASGSGCEYPNANSRYTSYGGAGLSASVTVASQGSDTAHNNLQPYIVVYFWRRTA